MKKFFFLFLFLSTFFPSVLKAQAVQLGDSAEISILTNSPWDGAVYGLFGHAAIRVKDPAQQLDLVFNYGIFDFRKPNFSYHFARGETDYMVAAIPYTYYIEEYQDKGQAVVEQVVNLSRADRQKVWEALYTNSLPENREYRYNFFFDNCATRLFAIVEKNISGHVRLHQMSHQPTFRQLINQMLDGHKWDKFGINLVIGASADRPVTAVEKMFLPQYLHDAFARAVVLQPDGKQRPLVLAERILNPKRESTWRPEIFSPMVAGLLLLLLAVLLSFVQWRRKRPVFITKLFDTLFFAAAGSAGVIITFLMFFSVHPCMTPNWNYVWLHPLHLIVSFLFFLKIFAKYVYCYHFINFALLTAFLLAWILIPQGLEASFLPFVAALWLRSGISVLVYAKKK